MTCPGLKHREDDSKLNRQDVSLRVGARRHAEDITSDGRIHWDTKKAVYECTAVGENVRTSAE